MSKYESLTYISKILWHFLGPKPESETTQEEILKRLDLMIIENQIQLAPYTKNGDYYKREFSASSAMLSAWGSLDDAMTIADELTNEYVVKEPKALCFCDIPINHLPVHMNKYGDIGIGISKSTVENYIPEFRPVSYVPIKKKDDFKKLHDEVKEIEPNIFEVSKYLKIPTNYIQHDPSFKSKSGTETFEQIYEEREWRTFSSLALSKDQISFILLPSRRVVDQSKYPQLYKLINSDVGVIYADELFDRAGRKYE